MAGQLLHFVGDVARPVSDWERDRVNRERARRAITAAVARAARVETDVAVIGRGPDAEDIPLPLTAAGPRGPVVLSARDFRRRLRGIEAWCREVEDIQARVYAVNTDADPDQLLGATIAPARDGSACIFLNEPYGANCPVIRIALVSHECTHWRRGECGEDTPFAFDQHSEDACDRVAEQRITEAIRLVELKSDPNAAPVDAAICQQCYREGSHTCLQSADTFERIQLALRRY